MRRIAWIVALGLFGSGVAFADAKGADRDFVDKAAAGGMAEVKLAMLAMERAQSMEVKKFARKMLEDHNKANTELKGIAEKKNLEMPAELDAQHRVAYEKLAKLDGADFDREYMKVMMQDHDATVVLFKEQVKRGEDPELRAFASKTLPVLEKHDNMAHEQKGK